MSDGAHFGGIAAIVKKFSLDDLVVLLVSEGIGVPLTIAGGEAFAHELWRPATIGYGGGLPLMAIGVTFPFWKNYVWARLRDYIVKLAFWFSRSFTNWDCIRSRSIRLSS